MEPKPCVFIHTNHRQHVGSLVAQYSFRRNSAHRDAFDVRIITTEDHPFLRERDGQEYLRDGRHAVWTYENLQSFTPLRFMPPELMGYEGRALVVDPDVFAIGDPWDLLSRDMEGKAVMARYRSGLKGREGIIASSVMLLDCSRLRHWDCERMFSELFAFERDYMRWIGLKDEDPASIGILEHEWNDFDRLTPRTKFLHNTKRQTQPWKTGLPVDFDYANKGPRVTKPSTWLRPIARLLGRTGGRTYIPHPDPKQEHFFFGLLKECLEEGIVTEELLRAEMAKDHLRHDALEVLEATA